uniref:Uncharacterized protein n=1 Tax=Meloidogyne hapla TaxID=6305 RepID=A0A1I8B9I3_MELHA
MDEPFPLNNFLEEKNKIQHYHMATYATLFMALLLALPKYIWRKWNEKKDINIPIILKYAADNENLIEEFEKSLARTNGIKRNQIGKGCYY